MLQKIFFSFFLLLTPTFLFGQSITEGIFQNTPTDPIPKDTKILQEAVWKNYRLQLMVSPSKPYLRGPADFLISAKKEIMRSRFAGLITISFENLAKSGSPLQETQINPDDFEEEGLAKVSHTFTEPGNYAVTLSFTDPTNDLFVLRANVEIRSDNFFLEYQKHMTYLLGGFFFLFILWLVFKKLRKGS